MNIRKIVNEILVENDLLYQVVNLSSGTLATLTGEKNYSKLDKIHTEFVDFAQKNNKKFKKWPDAWKAFWKQSVHESKKTVDVGIKEILESFILGVLNENVLSGSVKNRINKAFTDLITPRGKTEYFRKIPLDPIFDILKKYKVIPLQEDYTEWDGFLLGREGTTNILLGSEDARVKSGASSSLDVFTPYKNAMLRLTWYKMPESGNYEINVYVS